MAADGPEKNAERGFRNLVVASDRNFSSLNFFSSRARFRISSKINSFNAAADTTLVVGKDSMTQLFGTLSDSALKSLEDSEIWGSEMKSM